MPRNHNPDFSQIFDDELTLELFAGELVRGWVIRQTEPATRAMFDEWLEALNHAMVIAADDLFRAIESVGGENHAEV